MLLNHSLSLINLLQVRSRFDLHQEWVRLTNSNQRASDVTFAEFSTAFESIQKAFVDSPDMSPWRSAPGGRCSLRRLVGQVTDSCTGVSGMTDREIERAAVRAVEYKKLILWPGDRMLLDRVAYARSCRAAAACSKPRVLETVVTPQIKGQQPNDVDPITKKDKIKALVRRLGDAIAAGEGGGYESYNSGTDGPQGKVLHSRSDHEVGRVTNKTINEILATKSKLASDPARLFATGKYQTIIPTLTEAKKKLGLTGEERYTAEMQERVFREFLIPHAGGKHVLEKFIFGGEGTVADAQYAASKEWASIAVPSGKRTSDGRTSDGALSYYDRPGQNSANQGSTKKIVGVLQDIYEAR